MPAKLVIDGYNLIGAYGLMRNRDLQNERDTLIKKLSDYKKIKKFDITIVFDGWRSNNLFEGYDRTGGVSIIYSRTGESADEVIKKIVKGGQGRENFIVVTSDREVADFCNRYNATVVSSGEFKDKMELASVFQTDDFSKDEDSFQESGKLSTKKKGNPRRLSKEERKIMSKLKKL